jgi:enoyl-CoA hydratase/carnithine racemase/predicted dinucleotide-binding enzyme
MAVAVVGIAGGGELAAQLAVAVADAGLSVLVGAEHERAVISTLEHAEALWQERSDAGALPREQLQAKLALIEGVRGLDALARTDLVIEAVPDQTAEKQSVLSELDELLPSRAVLATSTAALSVSELAEGVARPERVVGLHFIEPAASSRVVEVVEGELSAPEAVKAALAFVQSLRRTPIRCADAPGFVLARVLDAGAGLEPEPAELRMLVESCLVAEEGVATVRDIDLALAAGAGHRPPPLAGADRRGLGESLALLEQASVERGPQFEPPALLRRLVAQGRLGVASGQGFFAYPRPDPGWEERPVKLESRGEIAIAWLDRPPANSISPEVAQTLRELWRSLDQARVRALVLASASPVLFCAGADIKAFAAMSATQAAALAEEMHALLAEMERSAVVTIAAVGGPALGGGCELAMGCDLRIASESASFGQPEIGLGIIPGFGATQRLPRLLGTGRALELMLSGEALGAAEARELGLVSELVEDHELLDAALFWARQLAGRAPRAIEQIKRLGADAGLSAGLEAERQAFSEVFATADAAEGFAAFQARRNPTFRGR